MKWRRERRATTVGTVWRLQVIRLDPGPIVRGSCISRGAATMSDVVENGAKRTRGEGFGGERGSRGRRPLFR
jgi:hypothetical protein